MLGGGRQNDHGSLSINWKETRTVEPTKKQKKNEKQNPRSPEDKVETHATSPPQPPPPPPPTTTIEMGNHNLATLMSISVVVLMMVTSVAKAQTADCASKLVPCASYINSTSPPATCCNPIKEAVATQLPCLCALYTSPGVLKSFGITVEQALNLTRACGVGTDVTKCNGIFLPFFFLSFIF